jgi:5-amino-6-(5-phosphoribosylamino)uracil reductase
MSSVRPRVLINFASSLDGKINPAPGRRAGVFMMSRHREDFRRMLSLRARADAILIGASNLRADNPDLALPPDEHAARRAGGQAEPLRIVLTSAGVGITPAMRMFDAALGGPSIVACTRQMSVETRAILQRVAEVAELGDDTVTMTDLLGWLYGRGVRTLLCEGGGELCAELYAARAIDEVHLTIVPRILGGVRASTMVGGSGFGVDQIPDGHLAAVERVEDELYLRYEFNWA